MELPTPPSDHIPLPAVLFVFPVRGRISWRAHGLVPIISSRARWLTSRRRCRLVGTMAGRSTGGHASGLGGPPVRCRWPRSTPYRARLEI